MKKLITAAIVILLVAVFAASVSAETVGTVVYAQKTDTVPNLEQIDESWGEPSIIINSKSPNTELYTWWNDGNKYLHSSNDNPDLWTLYVNSGKTILPEDYDVELYYRWDDKNLYFGLKTHDDHFAGWLWPWEGDGVQMWLEPMEKARADGFLYSGVNPHDTQNPESKMFDFAFTLDIDDYSVIKGKPGYTNAATEYECHINTDKEGELHCIITIPLIHFGFNPKKEEANGLEFATALLRVTSVESFSRYAYAGWLSWGKYFTDSTASSLNTVILTDSTGSETTPPPATETNPPATEPNLDGVSSWAKEEVEKGIAEGLVPAELQQNYTTPVTRGQVAQMFINLLEKATGKTVDEIMAEKGVAINEGAFTDTTDKAVLAANALGIINGTGNGKFSPDGTLKRAQIAAIINRVAKVMGVETEGYTHEFTDITDNYKWADSELGWPVYAGIINGVGGGKFNPGGDLTTEQAILITYRGLSALKK